jgi:hypothetical protein
MRSNSQRKLTRFYIINPITDRRVEQRFESREQIFLRIPQIGRSGPAVAYDIGRSGLRLECDWNVQPGMDIELAFPNSTDNMKCYGNIVWCKERAFGKFFECGISIEVWHGIVEGENSWTKVRGAKPKPERRNKGR